ncbi:MAG: hypothetical protein HYY09_08845 [Firmicutes bacterium]|nr:hypothetical protein [Bacillota bacterium]
MLSSIEFPLGHIGQEALLKMIVSMGRWSKFEGRVPALFKEVGKVLQKEIRLRRVECGYQMAGFAWELADLTDGELGEAALKIRALREEMAGGDPAAAAFCNLLAEGMEAERRRQQEAFEQVLRQLEEV